VPFDAFDAGVSAARALAQSGLHPSNCRLLDRAEARFSGTGDQPVLLVGFESADHPVEFLLARALECCADHGGSAVVGPGDSPGQERGRDHTADTWRRAFFDMPYLRDGLVAFSAIAETFETAVTWDRFPTLHAAV